MSYQYNSGMFATVGDGINGKVKSAVVCQIQPGAKMPERAHPTDAGADLFCWLHSWAIPSPFHVPATHPGEKSKLVIPPGNQMLVDTGVSMKIPEGYAGFLHARSSQRSKSITCWGTGIIDSAYRGGIKVVLYNGSEIDYVIENGDKIAQLIIQKVELTEFIDLWNDTARGTGGFGSTGK